MEVEKKKLVVITAAVSAYLESEKEQVRVTPKPATQVARVSAWGQSGRRDAMKNRIMMQRRALRWEK